MQPSQEDQTPSNVRPGTPPRPPYSPVTPVFAHLAPIPGGASVIPPPPASCPSPTTVGPQYTSPGNYATASQPPVFTPEPAPVPISESENPDAIALRSAISILQLQKQQSLKDIQTLDRMKKAAAADPERFARELAAGNLRRKDDGGFISFEDGDGDGDGNGQESQFGKLPSPQNIVRMPPINWAKYQVVGEPLDKMHEEQRRRPSPGEPRREEGTQRAPEYVLASPYRPLVDKLENPTKARNATATPTTNNKGRKA